MKCILCNENAKELHHFIPKFLIEMLNLNTNPDLFRCWLCEKHHWQVTNEYNKIRLTLKKLIANPDEWIESKYGEEIWSILGMIGTNHKMIHDLGNCPECNKPMEKLWVRQLIENGADEGKRHISRYKIMMNLKRFGIEEKKIKEKIMEFNRNCRPPEQEKIVLNHVRNTLKR